MVGFVIWRTGKCYQIGYVKSWIQTLEFVLELYGNMKIYKDVMQNDVLLFWWWFLRKKTNLVKQCQMFFKIVK